jgi:hypothetical protein
MEIKILITDGGTAGGSRPVVSVENQAGGGGQASAAAGVSAATFSAQDRAGAIDAGAAPAAAAVSVPGQPQPFVAQREANVFGPGAGSRSSDESGGAAPGSGFGMEVSTGEAG